MADFGWAFVKGNLVTGSAPPSGAVQFNDGNNKFAASGDLVFISGSTSQLNLTGNLDVIGDVSSSATIHAGGIEVSGNVNISGTLAVNELLVNVENRNVTNISATGSTQFGDTTDDTHVFTGSMSISASANPLILQGVQPGTPPNTSSYLALDSNYQLVLTSAAGESSGGTIGEAEDGTYTDGLFSDFTENTPIGTAIDKFNEILKIIVPGPAPAVDRIDYTNTSGIETKLSFETSIQAPTGYVDVDSTGSFTSPPGIDDQYTVTTSGEDFRLGVYDGTQEITGVINFNVAEQLKTNEVNYSTDAFGNAESGSLNLYLNETLLRTLDLSSFTGTGNPNTGSASDLNSNGSGFFDVSVSASATDQNGSTYDIFQHRTAKYVIDPSDQNKGWNYAKIEHVYGSTTYVTNFVQWFNDTDASSQAMTVSSPSVTFTGNGSKFLSGVKYFRSASLAYSAEVSNVYKFTYPTGNVLTFNESANLDPITAQSLPSTNATNLFDKVLQVAASTETNDDIMLNDSATLSFNLTHPFKTNLSTAGSVTTDEILIYNRDTANSNTLENFEIEEGYRIQINDYNSQSDVTAISQAWSSNATIDSGKADGYNNGLIYYNSRLYSPLQGANGGDFSSLANGPTGNENYSGVTGTQTFYRKIENTTGSPVRDLKIISTKNTKINTDSLSDNDNVKFSVKIPGVTGWMVISDNFTYGNISDDDGALINGANDNSNTGINDTGNSDHCITFGTASIPAGQYAVVKIEANAGWTKYFETLQFQLGASDDPGAPVAAPALDDIDSSNNGNDNAKLSFGTSNPISGFVNVEGDSTGSMEDINSNERYRLSGDRRGVFSSKPVILGTLNQDVGASGDNYPANSFHNAYTGSLVLEVNGTEVHEVSLASSLNAVSNDYNGNSSGFSFSAVSFSETSDSIPDYTKPYRTGDYQIGTDDQNVGWNYARVIHRTATDQTTNYVEWVVDTSASVATSISSPTLTNFNHTNIYYQSGIGYFASNPTASFSFSGSNFYNNVYQNGNAISFPTLNSASINSITGSGTGLTTLTTLDNNMDMPALDNSPDCELTDITVSASVTYTGGTSISGGLGLFTSRDASVSGRIIHPLKSGTTTTSTASKTAFMRYSGSNGSTDLGTQEYFNTETYRIISGNYATQADVTSSSNAWDSSISMNDGASYPEYNDGMVTANGYLISPFNIGNAGDTRNVDESGTLQAPAGNPNYSDSELSESVRTYYRYFRNTGLTAVQTFNLYIEGDATIVAKQGSVHYGALDANNRINIELKVPGQTAWGDIAIPWNGITPNFDGAGMLNGGNGNLDQDASDGSNVAIKLSTLSWPSNDYLVVKISAHKDWTGYLTQVTASY
jgi:hypothetical protein